MQHQCVHWHCMFEPMGCHNRRLNELKEKLTQLGDGEALEHLNALREHSRDARSWRFFGQLFFGAFNSGKERRKWWRDYEGYAGEVTLSIEERAKMVKDWAASGMKFDIKDYHDVSEGDNPHTRIERMAEIGKSESRSCNVGFICCKVRGYPRSFLTDTPEHSEEEVWGSDTEEEV